MNTYLRRISRFRVSTLLILLTLVCIGLGTRTYQARTQQSALDTIRKLGGTYECTIDPNIPIWLVDLIGKKYFQQVIEVELRGRRFDDQNIDLFSSLKGLERLTIVGTRITDQGMKYIRRLTNLEELRLTGPRVTDKTLAELHALTNLRKLSLPLTGVTDNGLGVLRRYERLESLNLGGTDIGDRGAEIIGSMQKLRHLWLSRTKITDDGLKHLTNLSNLTSLYLRNSLSTPKGIQELVVSVKKTGESFWPRPTRHSDELRSSTADILVLFDDRGKARLSIRWSSLDDRSEPVVREVRRTAKADPIEIAVPSIFQDEIEQRLVQ